MLAAFDLNMISRLSLILNWYYWPAWPYIGPVAGGLLKEETFVNMVKLALERLMILILMPKLKLEEGEFKYHAQYSDHTRGVRSMVVDKVEFTTMLVVMHLSFVLGQSKYLNRGLPKLLSLQSFLLC